MDLSIPSLADFDRVVGTPSKGYTLTSEEVARKIRDKGNLTALTTAVGVIVAVMLHSLPARAADDAPLSGIAGLYIAVVLIVVGIGFAVWPRRERAPDPHAEPYGDIPGDAR